MTIETFKNIIEDNNIPDNTILMSDSGWEGNETDMNGVYYNRNKNIIIFTQYSDYSYNEDPNYEVLYATDYIPHYDDIDVVFWPMAKDIDGNELFTQLGCNSLEDAQEVIKKWEDEFILLRKWIDTYEDDNRVGREYV